MRWPPLEVHKMKLSENDRKAAFALLVLSALGAAAYVFFLSEPADLPSDGRELYYSLKGAGRVGILYDVRMGDDRQISAIYQCGVDIISKGRFAGIALENIACDASGCLSVSTERNGTDRMTYEQAKKRLSAMPYILIKPADSSSYQLFQRHMEIDIGKNFTNASRCDISATES